MLSPSDAALVERDPALPALTVLLDDDEISTLLGGPVRRDYLRYKPGTSCVLGARIPRSDGLADILVTAYDAAGALKIDKTVADAPRGAVLHVDRARGLVAVLATGDRDLPLLHALSRNKTRRRALEQLLPGRAQLASAPMQTLSYKPMRRWVGLLTMDDGTRVVLRAYRHVDAMHAAAVLRELAGGPPRLPRLLGVHEELGCLALEYLEGEPLDELLAADDVRRDQLADVGSALARLHDRPAGTLPVRRIGEDVAAVQSAADQIAVLLPELAGQAQDLAEQISMRMPRQRFDPAVIHGDFSADQIVLGASGACLLDLDRAVNGDAATDVATLAAASIAGKAPAGRRGRDVLAEITAGYASARPLPTEEAVRTHTAALLLRRVVEPFRRCEPDWQDRARVLLTEAARALPGPLDSSVDDVLVDVVGAGPTWKVLKDKPGRRRTSRASGPHGTAIVKVYASKRAPVVAQRVRAVQDGPSEPVLPRVLVCDETRHLIVLTEVPGRAFRDHLLAGDLRTAERVGKVLAGWHTAHRGRTPEALRVHTAAREVEILLERSAAAPSCVAQAVRRAVARAQDEWPADTVVHRDLYEDQIVVGDQIGLLDLDDAAIGPAELDLGNLLAHLDLLEQRTGITLGPSVDALLSAYARHAPMDHDLLSRCRLLSVLRLACLHSDPTLLPFPVPHDHEPPHVRHGKVTR